MADAPAPAKGGPMGVLAKKVGPLPLGVWLVAVLGVGYWYYKRSHPSTATSSATSSTGTAPSDQTTYVPGFDAAGASGGGGIGATSVPGAVTNNYYGDTAAQQAAGGGTSSGTGTGTPTTPIGGTLALQPVTPPVSSVGNPGGPGTPTTPSGSPPPITVTTPGAPVPPTRIASFPGFSPAAPPPQPAFHGPPPPKPVAY